MEAIGMFVVCAFAIWHAVEVYHHSKLFEGIRAEVESWESGRDEFLINRILIWLSELMQCPFCLSLWVAIVLVFLWATPLRFSVVILAAARGANLLNDLTHHRCRTPGSSNVRRDDVHDAGEA